MNDDLLFFSFLLKLFARESASSVEWLNAAAQFSSHSNGARHDMTIELHPHVGVHQLLVSKVELLYVVVLNVT